ncbi:MAG: hypothetical protein WCA35_16145 [Kovacikia sp.]
MAQAASKYGHGQHPHSQANLTYNSGRPRTYGAEKKKRYLSVTDEGWDKAKEIAEAAGCSGVSDLLEKLGRGQLKLSE